MMKHAFVRSETKSDMEQIGISLHSVKSKDNYNVQFICNACKRAANMLHPVAKEPGLRALADRTMMQIFSPYFNVLSMPVPHPPPPPPLKTKCAPPPPSGARALRDADYTTATSATSTDWLPYDPPGAPPVKYHLLLGART